jgi:hypothetical protein
VASTMSAERSKVSGRTRVRRWIAAVLAAAVALGLAPASQAASITVFAGTTSQNLPLSLDTSNGQVVLLDFFANYGACGRRSELFQFNAPIRANGQFFAIGRAVGGRVLVNIQGTIAGSTLTGRLTAESIRTGCSSGTVSFSLSALKAKAPAGSAAPRVYSGTAHKHKIVLEVQNGQVMMLAFGASYGRCGLRHLVTTIDAPISPNHGFVGGTLLGANGYVLIKGFALPRLISGYLESAHSTARQSCSTGVVHFNATLVQ